MKNILYVLKAFIVWMVVKLGERIAELHNEFRNLIRKEFGLAFLLWILFSMLGVLGFTFLSMLLVPQEWVRTVLQCAIASSVTYFAVCCLSNAYQSFVQEREEIFDRLKR